MSDYVDMKEATTLLNVTRQWVMHLIKTGELEARKFGNAWGITKKSIEEYRKRVPAPKRPEAGSKKA